MDLITSNYCDEEIDPTLAQVKETPTRTVSQELEGCYCTNDDIFKTSMGYVSTRKKRSLTTVSSAHSESRSPSCSTLSSYTTSTLSYEVILSSYELSSWKAHKKPIMFVDWHPFHPHVLLSSSLDGMINVWDILCHKDPITSHGIHTKGVHVAKWISSSHVVSGSLDKSVLHTDMETMQVLKSFQLDDMVTSLSIHPTDPAIFVTGTKKVQLWDLRTGSHISDYFGTSGQILDLTFINNGNELVASSDVVRKNAATQKFIVWDSRSVVVKSNQIYCEPYTCPCLRIHPYNNTFMAQSNANYIVIFSSRSPYRMNKYKRFESHTVEGYNTQFDVSSDGNFVASASANGCIYVYDCKSTRILKTFKLHSLPSISVQWNHTVPSLLACSFWDGSLATFQYM